MNKCIDQDPEEGTLNITKRTVVISGRKRTPANAAKITILKSHLDLVADEDVDHFFLAYLDLAASLGYKFQGTAQELLVRVNEANGS